MNVIEPVKAILTVTVGFHPHNVCCDGCRFCRTDTTNRDRKRCAISEEILFNTKQRGLWCPLVFGNDDELECEQCACSEI